MPSKWVERFAQGTASLPRGQKTVIALAADGAAVAMALFFALLLRRGSVGAALQVPTVLFVLVPAVYLTVFSLLGMYRAVFRFLAQSGLMTATLGVLVSSALLAEINIVILKEPVATNALVISGVLILLYLVASRSLLREFLSFRRGAKSRVAIYGAGAAGAQLVRSLRDSGEFKPVAFIDDDPALQGRSVSGIKVYSPASLQVLIKKHRINSVLLALPSCSRRRRSQILESLEPLPVHVRTVPDIADIVHGRATVSDLRDVDANDLLGRDPVAPNEALLDACIRGKVVMVTGAGGSIGSELCRQIVALGPRRIVLLELSEHALYKIERELLARIQSQQSSVEVIALLGNALHRYRVQEIMCSYGVQTVYHAAAYKHVPIVERNIIEGIHNNIFSTWHTAEAAVECGVETFVLISSDKAVNPTNVMGATKRFAELTLQALQELTTKTRLCMVRFGNVLESSGSVVPLFREQIEAGGPVTVTHRDMIRYFMTIPEASQLVLQAGSMAEGGDVFVLDMGEPVRILDLAKRMISAMGLTVRDESNPDGDIEIVFTGLRPAEKLYEELLIGNNVSGTQHRMIMRAHEPHLPWPTLKKVLIRLDVALDAFDCHAARELIRQTVVEYRPQSHIQDLVWLERVSSKGGHKIVDSQARRGQVVVSAPSTLQ